MNSKQIKSALKEAREAIRTKDFKTAQTTCQAILNSDKNNYNALVFFGVASQELEQFDEAKQAYEKATVVAPEQILAWQGLCSFYEKVNNAEEKEELSKVYIKLVDLLNNDKDKQFEILGKLAQIYIEIGNPEKCLEILQRQLQEATDPAKQNESQLAMIKVLTSQKNLNDEYLQLLDQTVTKLMKSGVNYKEEERKQWLKDLINLLRKAGKFNLALEKSKQMMEQFPEEIFPLETSCKIHLEVQLNGLNLDVGNQAEIMKKLKELSPDSKSLKLALAAEYLSKKDFNQLTQIIDKLNSPKSIIECLLLVKCNELLHRYEDIVKFSNQGLQLLKENNSDDELVQFFTISRIKGQIPEDYDDSSRTDINILLTILEKDKENVEIVSLIVQLYLKTNDIPAAYECLHHLSHLDDNPNVVGLIGMINNAEEKLNEAQERLKKATEKLPENGLFLLELGLVYRALNENSQSLLCLLKAAKQDPCNPKVYLYLGHYYKMITDLEKAQRCYKKSFSLNKNDKAIGIALSDLLRQIGKDEENFDLLTLITKGPLGFRAKWAWLRLGLHYLRVKDHNAAVVSLQSCLKSDPLDPNCWEALADAYMTRGSYQAALKSFERALELNPSSVYCSYQMANIKQLLQEYSKAVLQYKLVLEQDSDYIPALKGLGETLLQQSQFYSSKCFYGRALDFCQEALSVLTKAAYLQPQISCLWKLMGDACTLCANLPPENCNLHVSTKLLIKDSTNQPEYLTINQDAILTLGAKCYAQALNLRPECSSLWHDLGINYYSQAKIQLDNNSCTQLMNKAVLALKKAVSLKSSEQSHWNALGVLAASEEIQNYSLSQHAFISSIKAEQNNVVAWTNLGVLYLINKNAKLAHEAFKMAQSLDPSYINCWIGQALIGEMIGHSETMDLFRHASTLGYHSESEIGYAHWVCQVLQDRTNRNTDLFKYNIEQMAAVPSASDCVAHFTDRIRNNSCAFNLYGLLLERQGLFKEAKKAFEKAFKLVEEEGDSKKIDQVRSNYARILCSLGYIKEAVNHYNSIKEPDFDSQCGLALANFKAGLYTESYQAYEAAIHWFATSDEEKAHVLVAMSSVAYKMEDFETVKTLLFQSSELQPASVHGLMALCALGLLQSHSQLTTAALQALLPFTKDPEYMNNITSLFACTYLVQKNIKIARWHISKAVHENPTVGTLWSLLGRHLMQEESDASVVAANCFSTAVHYEARTKISAITKMDTTAYKSSDLGSDTTYDKRYTRTSFILLENAIKSVNYWAIIDYFFLQPPEIAAMVALSYLFTGNIKLCLKAAQKAIHSYPTDISNWCSLIAALNMKSICLPDENFGNYISMLFHFVRDLVVRHKLENPTLNAWINWYNCLMAASYAQFKEALTAIHEVSVNSCHKSEHTPTNVVLQKYLDCLVVQGEDSDKAADALQCTVINNPTLCIGWQALVKCLIGCHKYLKAEKVSQLWCQKAIELRSKRMQLLAFINLSDIALRLFKFADENQNHWLSVAEKAIIEAAKLNPNCNAIYFIMAIISHHKKNLRLLKRSLQKASSESLGGFGWLEKQALESLELVSS